ncbi:PKD domain-containing protein [Flammeovirga pectinis]|uniref:PKD domain-containing protein n=1 Tax=Flammeovirga pectinis TaxID=2494373 RepID=A0A3S9P503_9BACT|nr:PKD domain-containing protein [Flammeovirga pectinis]AZQ63277.1 PKD domain-containing protein [Flammeovirga pectinis]
MKNLLYISIAVLISLFTSCGNDDPEVALQPKAEFTVNTIDHETLELIVDNSSLDAPTNVNYQWTWGDGEDPEINNNATLSHNYTSPDQYSVTLKILDLDTDQEVSSVTESITIGDDVNEGGIQIQFSQTNYGAWDTELFWNYINGSSIEQVKSMYVTLATDAEFTNLLSPSRGLEIGAPKVEEEFDVSEKLLLKNLASSSEYFAKIRFLDKYDKESVYTIEFTTHVNNNPTIQFGGDINTFTVQSKSNNLEGYLDTDFTTVGVTNNMDLTEISRSEDGTYIVYFKNIGSEAVEVEVSEIAFNREKEETSLTTDGEGSASDHVIFNSSNSGPLTSESKARKVTINGESFIYIGDEMGAVSNSEGLYIKYGSEPAKGDLLDLTPENTYVITAEGKAEIIDDSDINQKFGLRILKIVDGQINAAVENSTHDEGTGFLLEFKNQEATVTSTIGQLLFITE